MTQKTTRNRTSRLVGYFPLYRVFVHKVLLEFLWIMRPRLLIIAPAIRLQREEWGGGSWTGILTGILTSIKTMTS